MKLSARSQLKGTVITSTVTSETVDELDLVSGHSVTAIIEASDVLVGK